MRIVKVAVYKISRADLAASAALLRGGRDPELSAVSSESSHLRALEVRKRPFRPLFVIDSSDVLPAFVCRTFSDYWRETGGEETGKRSLRLHVHTA